MSPGQTTRALIRAADRAALATTSHESEAWPYVSLVLCACDHAGAPLLLMSDLAVHSQNLTADSRLSLLFDGTAGLLDPLTGARASVLGRAERCDDAESLARFTARHPSATDYALFADFHLYRVAIERAHLVAGFGAIDWIDASDITYDTADSGTLAATESDIVSHMNTDHGQALDAYARNLLGLAGDGWTMTGIDPEGVDLRCGSDVARLTFDIPVRNSGEARERLVALAHEAQSAQAAQAPNKGDLQ